MLLLLLRHKVRLLIRGLVVNASSGTKSIPNTLLRDNVQQVPVSQTKGDLRVLLNARLFDLVQLPLRHPFHLATTVLESHERR